MRKIDEIFIHCSATPEGHDHDVGEIRKWHKQRGWRDVGYHYVIKLDGTVQEGRPLAAIGAHARGHNRHSIGICYVGGVDADMNPKDTRTDAQKVSLTNLITELCEEYPRAKVRGHNEVSAKACPSFDVANEYGHIGKKVRSSIAESTTVQASAVSVAAGAGSVVTAVGALDSTAQALVIGFACLMFLSTAWIIRERIKKWAAGDR